MECHTGTNSPDARRRTAPGARLTVSIVNRWLLVFGIKSFGLCVSGEGFDGEDRNEVDRDTGTPIEKLSPAL
jgi:hypothetical protein